LDGKQAGNPWTAVNTYFPKNTHAVEALYIEENLDDQSMDNISNPSRIKKKHWKTLWTPNGSREKQLNLLYSKMIFIWLFI